MCAVLQPHLAQAAQPQVGLVHQRGRLQGVSRPLLAQVVVGQLVELVVHQRDEVLERFRVPMAPPLEQLGDVAHSARRADHGAAALLTASDRGEDAAWQRQRAQRPNTR